MQKWEYCRVSFGDVVQHVVYMKPANLEYRDFKQDAAKSDTEGHSSLYRFIAQLGEDGWEMVGMADGGGGETEAVWMKRPLS